MTTLEQKLHKLRCMYRHKLVRNDRNDRTLYKIEAILYYSNSIHFKVSTVDIYSHPWSFITMDDISNIVHNYFNINITYWEYYHGE